MPELYVRGLSSILPIDLFSGLHRPISDLSAYLAMWDKVICLSPVLVEAYQVEKGDNTAWLFPSCQKVV